MSGRKTRDEIGAAIRHLMQYATTTEPWGARENEILDELFAPVAEALGRDLDDVATEVLEGGHASMALAFAFEECATVRWDNEGKTLVDVYLAQRGWREKPGGRRYLQALNNSEIVLWEVVAVTPGQFIDVRRYGGSGKVLRVQERSGSESVQVYDALAARVIVVGGERMIAGAVLSYSPESARRVERVLEGVPDELHQIHELMLAEGDIEAMPENLDEQIGDELKRRLPGALFTEWALGVLGAYAMPVTLANTDGEALMPTRARFSLLATREAIATTLSDQSDLLSESADIWTWLAPTEGDDARQRTVLGTVTLNDTHLELATNSAERAREGESLLREVLGVRLGSGLAVHETTDATLECALRPPRGIPASTSDAPHEDTAETLVKRHLDTHYRRTLDEPIPMLGNRTPRECAADPNGRRDVLAWLKTLEYTDALMPSGSGSHYDFGWLWAELGLESLR